TSARPAGMVPADGTFHRDRGMTDGASVLRIWFWPAFPVFFVGLWCAATYLLAILSGWRRLGAHYAAEIPISGQRFRFRSAKSGLVRYNSCLNFAAAPEGLYIWLLFPFRLGSSPLLVPWPDVSATPTREWMFSFIALTFVREPGIRFRIATALGEQIAAASRGALRITPA
ncbi:MAG: hypothetical protein ACREE7_16935, partial [Dongiaceae bacterium]